MAAQRTYYWEHADDESAYHRSARARDVAEIAHARGGEVGVIIDDGGPLRIEAVEMAATISETSQRLSAVR